MPILPRVYSLSTIVHLFTRFPYFPAAKSGPASGGGSRAGNRRRKKPMERGFHSCAAARLPELRFHPRPRRSGVLEAAARRRCLQAQIRAPYGAKPRSGRRGVASGPLGLLRDQMAFAAELPIISARSAQCQMAGAEPPPPWHAAPRGLWTVGSRRSPRPEALGGESLRNRGRVPSRYSWTGPFSERARP